MLRSVIFPLALALALCALPTAPALGPVSGTPLLAAVLVDEVEGPRLGAALDSGAARLVADASAHGFVALETRDPAKLAALLLAPVLVAPPASAAAVPDDPEWPSQWGPAAIAAPEAWDLEHGSTAVKIAVVDSGIDAAHPDLAGVPIELGTDFVEGDEDPQDENGHGTHVAGIAAAARGNGVGVAGMASATLVVLRVLDENAQGDCLDIALAVIEATARGAHVINLSLSCSADYAPLRLAVQAAHASGVLVVAAGGNVGGSGACPAYPGRYDEVLSVAALDSPTTAAGYSCQGPTLDLAAPGSSIVSTWRGGSYAWESGTSMAAPHVAGVAALVKSRFVDLAGAALAARLVGSASDLGAPGPDEAFGAGRVDAAAALA